MNLEYKDTIFLQGKHGYVELKGIKFEDEDDLDKKRKNDVDGMISCISTLFAFACCSPKDLFPTNSDNATFEKVKEKFYEQIDKFIKCADRVVKYDIAKEIIIANDKPLNEIML